MVVERYDLIQACYRPANQETHLLQQVGFLWKIGITNRRS